MLAEPQDLLIYAYLLSDIRHELLVLRVALLEESLVVFDFQIQIVVYILKVASTQNAFDKFGAMPHYSFLLLKHRRLVEIFR